MNIYKAPNLIISPKRKVYRRGGGAGALNDEPIYIHTLSLLPPPSPPPLHIVGVEEEQILLSTDFCDFLDAYHSSVSLAAPALPNAGLILV